MDKLIGIRKDNKIIRCFVEFENAKVLVVRKENTNHRTVINHAQVAWINRG